MTKKATKSSKRTAPPKRKPIVAPSPEQVAAARARRKVARADDISSPGTVYGLDSGVWKSATIDPDLSSGQIERHRRLYLARGWIELEGIHAVSGYPVGAIVFLKKVEDYQRDLAEQGRRRAPKQHGFTSEQLT